MQFLRSSTLLAGAILSAVSLVLCPGGQCADADPEGADAFNNIPDQKLDATASALQRVTDVGGATRRN